jgi:hypothetical protein
MSEITIVVCFVDIDGIVDHHRLNFPFMFCSIDDLLLAGIHKVSHFVIVNKESLGEVEETMVDSQTIVAVQTILK